MIEAIEGGGSEGNEYHFDSDDLVTPMLKQGGIDVEPVATKDIEGSTTGNSVYHTDLCSHTEMEKMGNTEWLITIEGICTKSQLSDLKRMNPAEGDVKVISEGHVGFVDFDKFTWSQSSDLQRATFFINGNEITEPIFKFQIQSRDDDTQ